MVSYCVVSCVSFRVMPCSVVSYYCVVSCHIVCIVLCCVVPCSVVLLCSVVLCSVVLCSVLSFRILLCSVVSYCRTQIVQCDMYWYKLKLKLELNYIVLYRISVLVVSIDRLYFAIHTI